MVSVNSKRPREDENPSAENNEYTFDLLNIDPGHLINAFGTPLPVQQPKTKKQKVRIKIAMAPAKKGEKKEPVIHPITYSYVKFDPTQHQYYKEISEETFKRSSNKNTPVRIAVGEDGKKIRDPWHKGYVSYDNKNKKHVNSVEVTTQAFNASKNKKNLIAIAVQENGSKIRDPKHGGFMEYDKNNSAHHHLEMITKRKFSESKNKIIKKKIAVKENGEIIRHPEHKGYVEFDESNLEHALYEEVTEEKFLKSISNSDLVKIALDANGQPLFDSRTRAYVKFDSSNPEHINFKEIAEITFNNSGYANTLVKVAVDANGTRILNEKGAYVHYDSQEPTHSNFENITMRAFNIRKYRVKVAEQDNEIQPDVFSPLDINFNWFVNMESPVNPEKDLQTGLINLPMDEGIVWGPLVEENKSNSPLFSEKEKISTPTTGTPFNLFSHSPSVVSSPMEENMFFAIGQIPDLN